MRELSFGNAHHPAMVSPLGAVEVDLVLGGEVGEVYFCFLGGGGGDTGRAGVGWGA